MKVLMVSTDRNILISGSAVSRRMMTYGSLVEELHIVLLSSKKHQLVNTQLSSNVWVYPTNSLISFLRPIDARKIGEKIVLEKEFVRGKSLVTAQDPFECGWAGLKIKKHWRLPLEIQLHTDMFSPYFAGFKNFIRKRIAHKVLKEADSVRVVTENLAREVRNITKSEISVLPIWIDKEVSKNHEISFDLHIRHHWKNVLLMVSRLAEEKDIPTAIFALAEVILKKPETGLVIVGEGTEKEKLKKLVKKLKLEDKVFFAGWQEELGSYYKTADIFLQTSKYEGYGMALVEAGLAELAVITTPVGLAKDLNHNLHALIFPIGNIELFKLGIIELIDDKIRQNDLGKTLSSLLERTLLSRNEYLDNLIRGWEHTSSRSI